MNILVITTGGTIGALPYDKAEDPPKVVVVDPKGIDFVEAALKLPEFSTVITRCYSMEPRDSKLIDREYRDTILNIIKEAQENRIIITHGTDTLLQSASYLYDNCQKNPTYFKDKIILITGSMVPLSMGPQSDGYQNISFSLKCLKELVLSPQDNFGAIYIVLCDYDDPDRESGAWHPHLYRFYPNSYVKHYTKDARYNRLKRV